MTNSSITSKDVIGWIVAVVISLIGSLVPLLIFYLRYRTDKKKSNKKILELEEMIYKQENKILKRENEELKKEIQKLEEENKKLKKTRK